jgi:predicted transcriptional regulator
MKYQACNSKSKSLIIRIDDDTSDKLDYLMSKTEMNKSKLLRFLIDQEYRKKKKSKTIDHDDFSFPEDMPF